MTDSDRNEMIQAIFDILNDDEVPLITAHVRQVIAGTFHPDGPTEYWDTVSQVHTKSNIFVAWKFCHLLHRVLRAGCQPIFSKHSMAYRDFLTEIGRIWTDSPDGYGLCIENYIPVLIRKMEFHAKYVQFSGDLEMSVKEFDRILDQFDDHSKKQFCIDLFDYLDVLIGLETAVFNSIEISSMSNSEKCRQAVLIPCIQDSNQLYDLAVRIMFKLHSSKTIKHDSLRHHRERFTAIFFPLRNIYALTNNLEYFKDSLTVPVLPNEIPNFLSSSDWKCYTKPVVVVAVENEDINYGHGSGTKLEESKQNTAPLQRLENCQYKDDKNVRIESLEEEINRLQMANEALSSASRREMNQRNHANEALRNEVEQFKEQLTQIKQENANLTVLTAEMNQGRNQVEEIARISDEKFTKLDNMYTELRGHYVKLARDHEECNDKLMEARAVVQKAVQQQESMGVKILELEREQSKSEEMQRFIQALQNENKQLRMANQKSEDDNNDLKLQVDVLNKVNLDLEKRYKNNQTIIDKMDREMEKTVQENFRFIPDYETIIASKDAEIDEMTEKITELENSFDLNCERSKAASDLDTINKLAEMSKEQVELIDKIKLLEELLHDAKLKNEDTVQDLLKTCIKSTNNCIEKMDDNSETNFFNTANILLDVLMKFENCAYASDMDQMVKLTHEMVEILHLLINFYTNGVSVSTHEMDVTNAEGTCHILKEFTTQFIATLDAIVNGDTKQRSNKLNDARAKLYEIIRLVKSNTNTKSLPIEDVVESEMVNMDKKIEEAAAQIQKMIKGLSSSSNPIKLEVNEKILDACTGLMQSIRILVQKSRILQEEIVSSGKGTGNNKEFYRRNHKWTEGMISAAKDVAQGAQLLVDAADKAVTGEGQQLDLIGAVHEIAASTAQLMYASRVKASADSDNLESLNSASKNVKKAVGAIVDIVEDDIKFVNSNEDYSKLTGYQAKKVEIEIKSKILKLEKNLTLEQQKLTNLRKINYDQKSKQ